MAADNQDVMNPFLVEVMGTDGGALVLECYQCGTCSGSCPVIDEMEYGPRRIMHLIQSGAEAEVLSSKDMWRCVSCYSCAHRCPRGIEITDLMADLRRLAAGKGYAHDKEAEFGQAFAETVQVHGRLYEPGLLIRYYLRVLDVVSLVGMVPMGVKMLLKGKLPFLPDKIRDPEEIASMGIVDSTKLKFASGVNLGKGSGNKRVAGGVVGGALLAFLTGLLTGSGRGKLS